MLECPEWECRLCRQKGHTFRTCPNVTPALTERMELEQEYRLCSNCGSREHMRNRCKASAADKKKYKDGGWRTIKAALERNDNRSGGGDTGVAQAAAAGEAAMATLTLALCRQESNTPKVSQPYMT